MRKIGHKIAKPFFLHVLHKPDFEGFSMFFTAFSRGFHWLFIAFSRFFHSVTIFVNSKLRPKFFEHWISLGAGPCSTKSHKNTTSKIITLQKTSVLKA